MKFITRELYQAMQGLPASDEDDCEAKWRRVWEAYRRELEQIQPKLPPGMGAFSDQTLHDGVVRSVARPSPSELVLEVDATRNPWGMAGMFRIRFIGVQEVQGIEDLVGDDWLYEEVHLHGTAAFDYRVLFWRSDFRVVADEVEVEQLCFDQYLLAVWLALHKEEDGTPEYDRHFWAFGRVCDMCEHDPDAAWRFVLAALAANDSTRVVGALSAGPLEDLLAKHPYEVIERIEAEARTNARFASLLGGVWQSKTPEDIWRRMQNVWDRRGWDGIVVD